MHPVQVRSHKDTLANHIKGTPEQNLVLWWVVDCGVGGKEESTTMNTDKTQETEG